MYPNQMYPDVVWQRQRQRGSALVMALFVIVLMSALILFLGRQLISSSIAVSYEVQGNRAFNAAQSGLQAGLVQLFPLTGIGSCAAVSANISFTTAGLNGCSATLSCQQVQNPDNSSRPLYALQSEGRCLAGEISTSRVVRMEAY